MAQLSLFDQKRTPAPPAAVDPEFIRKELLRVVRIVRTAQFMPWPEYEMSKWEGLFIELAPLVPEGEGARLHETFRKEAARLRATAA